MTRRADCQGQRIPRVGHLECKMGHQDFLHLRVGHQEALALALLRLLEALSRLHPLISRKSQQIYPLIAHRASA